MLSVGCSWDNFDTVLVVLEGSMPSGAATRGLGLVQGGTVGRAMAEMVAGTSDGGLA